MPPYDDWNRIDDEEDDELQDDVRIMSVHQRTILTYTPSISRLNAT